MQVPSKTIQYSAVCKPGDKVIIIEWILQRYRKKTTTVYISNNMLPRCGINWHIWLQGSV